MSPVSIHQVHHLQLMAPTQHRWHPPADCFPLAPPNPIIFNTSNTQWPAQSPEEATTFSNCPSIIIINM
jgi:hypothetical protein